MGDLCKDTPKPLLTVGEKSLLGHKLDVAASLSDSIAIVVSHMGDKIMDTIGTSWNGIPLTYCIQTEMKGTADALNCAKEFIGNEPFLVLMGDDIYQDSDIQELISYEWAVLLYDSENPSNEGKCMLDEEGNLKEIIDDGKGRIPQNLVYTGACVLQSEYFSWIPEAVPFAKEVGIPQTLAAHAHEKKIKAVITKKWHKINTPEELLRAHEDMIG